MLSMGLAVAALKHLKLTVTMVMGSTISRAVANTHQYSGI